MTAAYVPAYNPTDTPVAADDEGRTIGGQQWGTAHRSSTAGKAALDAGRLIELGELGDSPSAEVRAAVDQAARLNERHEAFARLDKAALVEHYTGESRGGAQLDEGTIPNVETLDVAELRAALAVRTAIPTPAKSARRAPSTEE